VPQKAEGAQEAEFKNYRYNNPGAGSFARGSAGQWPATNSPPSYGNTNPYVSPSIYPYSGHQNTAVPYGTPNFSYSLGPRAGFPAAGGQLGYSASHGASNQTSAYQSHYEDAPVQHQGAGRSMGMPQSNFQPSSSQNVQSGYYNPYSQARAPMAVPTSPYQSSGLQESSWRAESQGQHGGNTRPIVSPGGQYFNSAETGQSTLSGSTELYSAPSNMSPSEGQVDPALATQVLYDEAPSSPAQGETPIIEPAAQGARKQTLYRNPHGTKIDSSIIKYEPEEHTSHDEESGGEAHTEVPSYQAANRQRSQNTKSKLV